MPGWYQLHRQLLAVIADHICCSIPFLCTQIQAMLRSQHSSAVQLVEDHRGAVIALAHELMENKVGVLESPKHLCISQ
jgi:hypothetical protein